MTEYNSIVAKIHAMKRNLIKEDEYEALEKLQTVSGMVDYLKNHPTFAPYFANLNPASVGRNEVERRLYCAFNDDFARIYRFANLDIRRFMKLIATDFVILLIKKTMHAIYSDTRSDIDLSAFDEFFIKYSHIDPSKLQDLHSIPELIDALAGSPIYEQMKEIYAQHGEKSVYFETFLDNYFFQHLWSRKSLSTDPESRAYLRQFYGTLIDTLNLMTIYRSKKFYNLPDASIAAFVIPIQYRLTKDEINAMIHAEDLPSMLDIFNRTYYAFLTETLDKEPINAVCDRYLRKCQRKLGQKYPYSFAVVGSYFFYRQQEINTLVTITEGIRYQVGAKELHRYITRR